MRRKVKAEAGSTLESKAIQQLKAEMAKQEAKYYESLNKYITSLEGMKQQVHISNYFLQKNITFYYQLNQFNITSKFVGRMGF